MRTPFLRGVLAAVGMMVCTLSHPVLAPAQSVGFTVTDLGTLGGPTSEATAINADGQTVGNSLLPDGRTTHPFLYANGRLTDLGTPDGGVGYAAAINASGQVAGTFITRGAGQYHPFLFTPQAGFTDLAKASPLLASAGGSYASGVNSAGQVVGFIVPAAPGAGYQSFFNPAGQVAGLLAPPGGAASVIVRGINDAGQIAGAATSGNLGEASHAVIYGERGMGGRNLGTLAAGSLSVALAINDSGSVAGYAAIDAGGNILHAFIARPGEGLTDLGTLGGQNSVANAVNNQGDVVGDLIEDQPGTSVPGSAFLYTVTAGLVDLNDLIDPAAGWFILHAAGINDAGQIVGYGLSPQRELHAYLLTPGVVTPPGNATPVVSVVGVPAQGGFVVSRPAEGAARALTVFFHNGGSAVRDQDYAAFLGTLTFAAGQSEAVIPVTLLPGANRNHKVKVFLDVVAAGASYSVGKAQSKVFLSELP